MDILQPSKNGELRDILVRMDTTIDRSLLRDTVRGLIFKFLNSVSKGVDTERILQRAVRKDIVLRMILSKRDEAEKIQQSLRAKERETFKQRMRQMPDQEREVTKQLLDIGLAGYIITNEDRRMFAREQEAVDQDQETMDRVNDMDENMPPEGHNGTRDVEDGEAPIGENGHALETDYGDYGDRAERQRGDYGEDTRYDFGEGDGV
jgi:E3 ubiquitin-protein ligase DOA10